MENSKLDLAYRFVNYTGENIFLTGKAGTGKTTFLHNIKRKGLKRTVVVAPTGVAAINAGGVTIHSFFQMPFGPIIPETQSKSFSDNKSSFQRRFNKEKINIIKSMDLLIIDEISMVRADLLDGIDEVLRKYRDREKAFGGVQLLMIGDLEQLAPVIKEDEWMILREHYENAFFFSSKALRRTSFVSIVLDHVYRQSDQSFIEILNKVRNKDIDAGSLQKLNNRFIPGFIEEDNEGYIILTTHNATARSINQNRLHLLHTKTYTFEAEIVGDFPEHSYPTDSRLELKTGAQVMFVKNDLSKEKRYYNGKIGIIVEIEEDTVFIRCEGEEDVIAVSPVEWENMKYSIDRETKEISEQITGTFTQLPLKLAWAITIHKSQGLTFEKAIIDASASFAHGQVYVALCRCKSLEGMVLNSPIDPSSFIHNSQVTGFTKNVENNPPDEKRLTQARRTFEENLLIELFDFRQINYNLIKLKKDLESHRRSIAGNLHQSIENTLPVFTRDIFTISERFHPKIRQMLRENMELDKNLRLQEKISGASAYFLDKIKNILSDNFQNAGYETDNKEVKKLLNKSFEQIMERVHLKNICLKACQNGFDLANYLEIKAKAQLEDLPKKKKTAEKIRESGTGDVRNPELYQELVKWRNRVAEEKLIPHYMVMQLKPLVTLSNYAPTSLKEMKRIKGIGKVKLETYGEELLEIIRASGADNKLKIEEQKPLHAKKEKKEKIP
ncbi:MAG: HRDC domain-containing protein, partial [Bacteroidota bacterium]